MLNGPLCGGVFCFPPPSFFFGPITANSPASPSKHAISKTPPVHQWGRFKGSKALGRSGCCEMQSFPSPLPFSPSSANTRALIGWTARSRVCATARTPKTAAAGHAPHGATSFPTESRKTGRKTRLGGGGGNEFLECTCYN